MPQRNTIRRYKKGGYYHIYNRGVDKRKIFSNNTDYQTFLSIVDSYMTPKLDFIKPEINTPYWRSKLNENEIEILCFCLMPNHFHFLIKQNSKDGITRFMRRISNSYVSYFNKQYDRVGALFQGKFKAALVLSDEYLVHLSKYIHRNPVDLEVGPLESYPYSSYSGYVDRKEITWLNRAFVLKFFGDSGRKYKQFIETIDKTRKVPENIAID